MTDQKVYSRSELAAIARAPEDAVVFWIKQGLLVSVDRDARKHRRFEAREIKMAALLREARSIGLNVGAMRVIVARLRSALDKFDPISSTPHLIEVLNEDDPGSAFADYANLIMAYCYENNESILAVFRNDQGDWEVRQGGFEDKLPSASVVEFDFEKVFALDWPSQ